MKVTDSFIIIKKEFSLKRSLPILQVLKSLQTEQLFLIVILVQAKNNLGNIIWGFAKKILGLESPNFRLNKIFL